MKATFITINDNHITLGQFLKLSKVITNGGQARYFLSTNNVLVNELQEQRRGKKLYNGDIVTITNKQFVIQTKGN
ncbi:MAG: RNA-binding S4 domain-containing protein [Mycoplasmataceae bacterium]|jgi:S4 domain protein YaaA|nr:RNA-binding S4 domain-containing protein [Mycoplasmataceae bacterium]